MQIGTQLHAPAGFESLAKDEVCHLLSNSNDRVILVRFREEQKKKGIHCEADWIERSSAWFEDAIIKNLLCVCKIQSTLPPWLDAFVDRDLKAIVSLSPKREQRVERLEALVMPAIKDFDKILKSRDPTAALNQVASSLKQNTCRYRFHVSTYALFGRNKWVLMPKTFRSGGWDRKSLPPGPKLGRPSIGRGIQYGARLSIDIEKKILACYARAEKIGVPRTEHYVEIMRADFGCRATSGRWKKLHHPKGEVFPTFDQFDRILIQHYGLRRLQIDRFGEERVRNRISANVGPFSEQCANLFERVEGDAYSTDDHPRGIDGTILPPLYVVRLRDSTSGCHTGIGFSLAGERNEAYRMALFCSAVDKVRFSRCFGFEIKPEEWPCCGLHTKFIVDRGAGSTIEMADLPFREIAPSWSGQGKAIVESSHPCSDLVAGAPSYLVSELTPVQMAVREITQLLISNDSVTRKRTPRMIVADVRPTPLGVWEYLDHRGRNAGFQIPFDEAVRLFLTKIEVKCDVNGIQLHDITYRSPRLQKCGILEQALRHTLTLNAYILPMSVRQIWIEWQTELIEVMATLPIADEEAQLYLTITEVCEIAKLSARDKASMAQHNSAVKEELRTRFEDTVGKKFGKSRRHPGRPKAKTSQARRQTAAIKAVAEGK